MVAQLHPQPQPHPILGAVADARSALTDVRDVQPVYMTPAEKTTALQEITALEATLTDLKLRVLAVSGDVADAAGARDIGSWAAHLTHADPTTARAHDRRYEADRLPNGDLRFHRRP